jgi:hypothetical protein
MNTVESDKGTLQHSFYPRISVPPCLTAAVRLCKTHGFLKIGVAVVILQN